MKKVLKSMIIITVIIAVIACVGCSKLSNGAYEERKTDISWSVTSNKLTTKLDNTFVVKEGQNLQIDIDAMDGTVTVKVENSSGEAYLEVEVSESTSKKIKCEGKVKVTYKYSKFSGNISAKVEGKVVE